jgi:hypothetical protein
MSAVQGWPKLRLGPTLWLKIPTRARKLAQKLGQPCAIFLFSRRGSSRGTSWTRPAACSCCRPPPARSWRGARPPSPQPPPRPHHPLTRVHASLWQIHTRFTPKYSPVVTRPPTPHPPAPPPHVILYRSMANSEPSHLPFTTLCDRSPPPPPTGGAAGRAAAGPAGRARGGACRPPAPPGARPPRRLS